MAGHSRRDRDVSRERAQGDGVHHAAGLLHPPWSGRTFRPREEPRLFGQAAELRRCKLLDRNVRPDEVAEPGRIQRHTRPAVDTPLEPAVLRFREYLLATQRQCRPPGWRLRLVETRSGVAEGNRVGPVYS